MKSTHNNRHHGHGTMVARKRQHSPLLVIASLAGFLLFLTGGFTVVAAAIDASLNQFTTWSFLLIAIGFLSCKIGRKVMYKFSVD